MGVLGEVWVGQAWEGGGGGGGGVFCKLQRRKTVNNGAISEEMM